MPRLIVWHCDNCDRESRTESAGWLVVKEFKGDRPYFYSFCNWRCLSQWLSKHKVLRGVLSVLDMKCNGGMGIS